MTDTTLTAAEIAAMQDRELDALLAELMGWKYILNTAPRDQSTVMNPYVEGWWIAPDNPKGEWEDELQYFSTDHAAAAKAVDYILSQADTVEMEIHWWKDIGYSVLFVLWDADNIETEELPREGQTEPIYPQTEPRAKAEACALALLAITKK